MSFQPGMSGNPAGRKPGKTLKITELRKAIEFRADEILQSVINAAIAGDLQAAKMLLDRVCPTLKPQAMPINLQVHNSLADQGNEIIKSAMLGEIPPEIATQLIAALSNQAKIIETDELLKRVEELEQKNGNRVKTTEIRGISTKNLPLI